MELMDPGMWTPEIAQKKDQIWKQRNRDEISTGRGVTPDTSKTRLVNNLRLDPCYVAVSLHEVLLKRWASFGTTAVSSQCATPVSATMGSRGRHVGRRSTAHMSSFGIRPTSPCFRPTATTGGKGEPVAALCPIGKPRCPHWPEA